MSEIINFFLLKLKEKKISNPELDLRVLLKEASYKKKEIILSNLEDKNINLKYLDLLIKRRLSGEPVSKIINKKYFWKSKFFVNSDVLDPRPETEIIIEEVLNCFKDKSKKFKILDLGTGTGCLAISLAKEYINSDILAIDISNKALKVAKKNIELHNMNKQIKIKNLDIENVQNKFDLIVSNPPYIDENSYKKLDLEIKKYEPKLALIGGKDGLKFYRKFSKKIEKIMYKNSYFICEIGYNQLSSCKKIFNNTNLKLLKISKDLQKIDRTLTFLKI